MKLALLADQEMQEIITSHGITPNDITSDDHITTMNIESQYRELDGDTKKAKLIAQIKEINSRKCLKSIKNNKNIIKNPVLIRLF